MLSALDNRAGALTTYVKCCQQRSYSPFPFVEDIVFQYVLNNYLNKLPPTRNSAFMEALWPAHGLLGIHVDSEISKSKRIQGAVNKSSARKRLTKKRCALLKNMVIDLERAVYDSNDIIAIVVGFLLFCLLARLRCGDASRFGQEPKILDGFFELDADSIQPLQDAFRIDERIYRALVVRADELPPPPPPREPRRRPEGEAGAPPATEAPATEAAESSTTPSTAEVESVAPESSTAEASSAGGNEPGDDADENSATDTVEDETSAGTVEDETSAGTVEDETSADTVEDETSSSE